MASLAATSISAPARPSSLQKGKISAFLSVPKSVSFSSLRSFPSVRSQPATRRLRVSCAAKPETVNKVCEIVKKQLALSDDKPISNETKFVDLGADSLDTVEIVMGLEEEFGITVEEESAQSIATVQDAADLIEKLIEKSG